MKILNIVFFLIGLGLLILFIINIGTTIPVEIKANTFSNEILSKLTNDNYRSLIKNYYVFNKKKNTYSLKDNLTDEDTKKLSDIFRSIGYTGYEEVLTYLDKISWKFVFVLLLASFGPIFAALGWRRVVNPSHNGRFIDFLKSEIAGMAINQLMPSGNVGEVTKISVIQYHIGKTNALSSVMLFNLLNSYVTALLLILGVGITIFFLNSPLEFSIVLIIVSLIILLIIVFLRLLVRKGLIGIVIKILMFFRIKRGWINKNIEHIKQVDRQVDNFRKERSKDFWMSLLYLTCARLIMLLEIYLILHLINYPVSFFIVLVLQSITTLLEIIFAFIPATLGVLEGGSSKFFEIIQLSSIAGLSMELIRRIRKIIFITVGLVILFPYSFKSRKN